MSLKSDTASIMYVRVSFDDIITNSEAMKEMLELAKSAAESEVKTLIMGESGTGKELVARAIHDSSSRKDKPFIAVNCASIPDSLLESELFGHEKGAFTDAVDTRKGKFELADEGTLFLDEIGELSPIAQAKTLRAIEYRTFERVGGEKSITVNCRILAASNKDLFQEVKNKMFREDLYYRLHEVCLTLPPLRERKNDIILLINYFIEQYSQRFGKK